MNGVLDLFFPAACPLCLVPLRGASSPFCSACSATISPLPAGHCSCCALPFASTTGSSHLCADCLRRRPVYTTVSAAGLYGGALKIAVQRFKYAGSVDLDRPLGQLLLARLPDLSGDETIIPVPLHPARLRQRGYNQSLLLARVLAHKLRFPLEHSLLQRNIDGHSQQGLSAKARAINLASAFSAQGPLQGRSFLLIDDVMTTGATVGACTTALLKAGATAVRVAVVARAPRHSTA
ncbi:MAG: ComF family protein [Geopsychrobacter sp.]|nr:ComF family protein [Geopsychrobacter sp.]